LIGDVPSATAILDRFLHHAELITITGRSYRLRHPGSAPETAETQEAPSEAKPDALAPNTEPPATKTKRPKPRPPASPPTETTAQ